MPLLPTGPWKLSLHENLTNRQLFVCRCNGRPINARWHKSGQIVAVEYGTLDNQDRVLLMSLQDDLVTHVDVTDFIEPENWLPNAGPVGERNWTQSAQIVDFDDDGNLRVKWNAELQISRQDRLIRRTWLAYEFLVAISADGVLQVKESTSLGPPRADLF